ncbi:MAG TPA: GAF domain-containing protein, partial [Anaerolineae bacterium]|nr:GAF domain-containing protein [Anaerolineae bacterium]
LLWIIDTAPLFLGLLAYFAGQRQDVLQATYTQLQQVTTQLRQQEQTTAVELDRRTEQLRASAEVGRAAASMLDPDKLLHDVVNLIASRFNFYYAAIFLVDSNNEFAVLREATGETGRQLKERNHKLPINGTSMVSTAITTRRPRIALDVGEERIRFANPLLPNTRSEIALPLLAGDRVFGALDVQSTQEAAFDKPGAEVLQTMADQIAVALNNATSLIDVQAAAQRAKLTATLLSNAFELTTLSDRQKLYDRIIQLAMELINADGAGLALPVSDTELEIKASFDVGPNPGQMLGRRLRIGEDVSGRVFNSKQSLRIENYTTWTGRASVFTDAAYHAILGIPLLWLNKVVAVLTLTHSQPNRSF